MPQTAEIISLEKLRAEAWVKRDDQILARLLHRDYLEINVFGRFTRTQVLEEAFWKHELLEYMISDESYVDLGGEACALSYRFHERLLTGEQMQEFDTFVTATYLLDNGRWLLRLWQVTPIG